MLVMYRAFWYACPRKFIPPQSHCWAHSAACSLYARQSDRVSAVGAPGQPSGNEDGRGSAPSVWSQPWVPSFPPRCHAGLLKSPRARCSPSSCPAKPSSLLPSLLGIGFSCLAFVLLLRSPCEGHSHVCWTWGRTCLSSTLRNVRCKVSSWGNTCVGVVWRVKRLWSKHSECLTARYFVLLVKVPRTSSLLTCPCISFSPGTWPAAWQA